MKLDVPEVRRGGRASGYSGLFEPSTVILIISMIAALYFLISYSKSNASLLKENERLRNITAQQAKAEPGDAVPPFVFTDLEGRRVSVSYGDSRRHLLFIFTLDCPACVEQLPVWDKIATEIDAGNCVVHAVSLDPAEVVKARLGGEYQRLPVVLAPDKNFMRTYRVNAFPQVMLISGQGIVEWAHVGAMTDDKLRELRSRIGGGKI
jgi:peroxiredoxin